MTSALSDLEVQMTKELRQSDGYLKSKHNLLTNFDSIESLVIDPADYEGDDEEVGDDDPDAPPRLDPEDRKALTHHILKLRAGLARTLWSHQVYVSTSLLDDFVLHAAKTGSGGVPKRVIENLALAGADRPGFVLYPLVGFKMKEPMLHFGDSPLRTEAVFRKAGFAVSLQTNSTDSAIACVQRLARSLGIRQRIRDEDLRHFGRTVSWFGRNPLMLVKLTSHTFHMYENQFVYTLKIRLAAAHLLMLHALSVDAEARLVRERGVTSGSNNFSTLDIRHYAIGEAFKGRPIETIRVPMNVSALDLARLSDVPATLATDVLATTSMKRHERRITLALKAVETGYFRHVNMSSRAKPEKRLYARLVTALNWFRQSFSARANESEAIVAIAVALETLLTDFYAPGIIERLRRRVGLCVPRDRELAALQDSVAAIYKARSEIVHTGAPDRSTDVHRAQLAFIRCFCVIAERLPSARLAANGTVGHLIGDKLVEDAKPDDAL